MAEQKEYPTPVVPLPQRQEKTVAEESQSIDSEKSGELSFDAMARGFGDLMDRFCAVLGGEEEKEQATSGLQGTSINVAPPVLPRDMPQDENVGQMIVQNQGRE